LTQPLLLETESSRFARFNSEKWQNDAICGRKHALVLKYSIIFAENFRKRIFYFTTEENTMYWTLELATKLEDAPWPATKDELIDYAMRSGAPMEVIENLQEIEDEGETYESIEDIWPDYPTNDDDFFFNEDEY
jgi:hypothetical protein